MNNLVKKDNNDTVKEAYLDDKHTEYHLKQFNKSYRSTVHLCDFVKNLIDVSLPYKAIDVGCGAGANIFHLSKMLPKTSWVGLDWADKFFGLGKKFMKEDNCQFIKGDFYELEKNFIEESFDLVFSIQTLSWLQQYEKAMEQLIKISRGWIFVTSLFSDFHVDVISEVFEYTKNNNDWEASYPYNYNVYSFERFHDFCLQHGAKEVIAKDFLIDIDLEPPMHKHMGTYTIRTLNQKRLQFSGPLHMPWKFIAIKM